jgi:hypothetical protein
LLLLPYGLMYNTAVATICQLPSEIISVSLVEVKDYEANKSNTASVTLSIKTSMSSVKMNTQGMAYGNTAEHPPVGCLA